MSNIKELSSKEFASEVLKSSEPVLVDFYATWCGPCRILAPILDDVSTEVEGKVKVVKIDVDKAEDVARRYGVLSIPTMVLIAGGEEKAKMIGVHQKHQIIEAIKKHIK